MGDPKGDLLVWLDMEMTGLDPETCVPIELAILITTNDLVEKESYHTVIHQDAGALATMNDFVRDMHTKNGLLEKVAAATTSLTEADAAAAALVDAVSPEGDALLAGNSIHQDRRFIVRYFPELEQRLHYRMVDVSTVKELARRWYGTGAVFQKPESDHTALADTRESIAEMKFYRENYFR